MADTLFFPGRGLLSRPAYPYFRTQAILERSETRSGSSSYKNYNMVFSRLNRKGSFGSSGDFSLGRKSSFGSTQGLSRNTIDPNFRFQANATFDLPKTIQTHNDETPRRKQLEPEGIKIDSSTSKKLVVTEFLSLHDKQRRRNSHERKARRGRRRSSVSTVTEDTTDSHDYESPQPPVREVVSRPPRTQRRKSGSHLMPSSSESLRSGGSDSSRSRKSARQLLQLVVDDYKPSHSATRRGSACGDVVTIDIPEQDPSRRRRRSMPLSMDPDMQPNATLSLRRPSMDVRKSNHATPVDLSRFEGIPRHSSRIRRNLSTSP